MAENLEVIKQAQEIKKAAQRALPAAAVKASMAGNWDKVSEDDRMRFIKHMCDSLEIPLVLNPFRFISMRGKTVLYATAEAAFSLARKNKLTIQIMEEHYDTDSMIKTVRVRATFPNGQFTDDVGKLFMGGITSQDRANAEMKCITKAKRRAILSSLGLSILEDDSPVDGLQGNAVKELVKTPDETEIQEWREKLFDFCVDTNGPFEGDIETFNRFVKECSGKTLMKLNAAECEEILEQAKEAHKDIVQEVLPI